MRTYSFLFMLFASVITYSAASHATSTPSTAKNTSNDTLKMLGLFGDVFEKVKKDYVEEVSDQTLVESAINGMLTSLDPHSSYLNEKAFDEMKIQTRGEFGGLGIEVTLDNGLVKVVSPIDDTPAFLAGIKPGDYISYINDDAVMGMTLAEAVEKMRGKAGTKVKLTVLREGQNEPLELTLTRDVIRIKAIRGHAEGDVAYIRITSFSEQASTALEAEVDRLKKLIGPGKLKGIVLDLRNNPGGLLDQAVSVSDAFLDSGEIVSTRGRIADSSSRFNAHKGDIADKLPIVILINGGSASASEIVAGALQDHKRAVIMGTKSFGKGSVQTVIPIPSHGAIRLTTSRYYTPSGRSIQAEGIMPDIVVEPAKLDFSEGKDAKKLYSEASLRKHLTKGNEKNTPEKAPQKPEAAKPQENAPVVGETTGEKAPAKDKKPLDIKTEEQVQYEKDYQLARAVDLLKGIYVFGNSR